MRTDSRNNKYVLTFSVNNKDEAEINLEFSSLPDLLQYREHIMRYRETEFISNLFSESIKEIEEKRKIENKSATWAWRHIFTKKGGVTCEHKIVNKTNGDDIKIGIVYIFNIQKNGSFDIYVKKVFQEDMPDKIKITRRGLNTKSNNSIFDSDIEITIPYRNVKQLLDDVEHTIRNHKYLKGNKEWNVDEWELMLIIKKMKEKMGYYRNK